jgi:hypothetical protein
LHVVNTGPNNNGTPISTITVDFDGDTRSSTTPDIGADEFTALSTAFLGSDISICVGDSVLLVAGSPSDAILWSTGDTTTSIWVSTPGTYDVSINGMCGSGTDDIVISSAADVYTNFLEADTLWFCTGGSATLSSNMMADSY